MRFSLGFSALLVLVSFSSARASMGPPGSQISGSYACQSTDASIPVEATLDANRSGMSVNLQIKGETAKITCGAEALAGVDRQKLRSFVVDNYIMGSQLCKGTYSKGNLMVAITGGMAGTGMRVYVVDNNESLSKFQIQRQIELKCQTQVKKQNPADPW